MFWLNMKNDCFTAVHIISSASEEQNNAIKKETPTSVSVCLRLSLVTRTGIENPFSA